MHYGGDRFKVRCWKQQKEGWHEIFCWKRKLLRWSARFCRVRIFLKSEMPGPKQVYHRACTEIFQANKYHKRSTHYVEHRSKIT